MRIVIHRLLFTPTFLSSNRTELMDGLFPSPSLSSTVFTWVRQQSTIPCQVLPFANRHLLVHLCSQCNAWSRLPWLHTSSLLTPITQLRLDNENKNTQYKPRTLILPRLLMWKIVLKSRQTPATTIQRAKTTPLVYNASIDPRIRYYAPRQSPVFRADPSSCAPNKHQFPN